MSTPPAQQQSLPGLTGEMEPRPDHGEGSYRGSGRLTGKATVITGSTSVNSDMPVPSLLPYNVTKAGIANMAGSLSQLLGDKGIRANSVAPGPIWTPLIPSTMPPEQVENFGAQTPLGRPGQPAELAPVYVMLASDESSYVSGAMITVTGGQPML